VPPQEPRRFELPTHGLDIAQHPKLRDLAAAGLDERRAGPADFTAGRRDAEKFRPMQAMKPHSCRDAVVRCNDLVDMAREPFERRMNRPEIGDEPVRSVQFGSERSAKTKRGIE